MRHSVVHPSPAIPTLAGDIQQTPGVLSQPYAFGVAKGSTVLHQAAKLPCIADMTQTLSWRHQCRLV